MPTCLQENKIIQGAPKHSVLQLALIRVRFFQLLRKGSETNRETKKNLVKFH